MVRLLLRRCIHWPARRLVRSAGQGPVSSLPSSLWGWVKDIYSRPPPPPPCPPSPRSHCLSKLFLAENPSGSGTLGWQSLLDSTGNQQEGWGCSVSPPAPSPELVRGNLFAKAGMRMLGVSAYSAARVPSPLILREPPEQPLSVIHHVFMRSGTCWGLCQALGIHIWKR